MTESSARSQLEQMERDRLSVYVARSKVPWWYLPALGIGTGLMLASYELAHPLMTVVVVLAYVAGVGGMVRVMLDEVGILPKFRGMPASLLRPLTVFFAVALVVVFGGAVGALFFEAPWGYLELGVVACVVLWGGGRLALRVHEARAQRLADEMGIER